MFAFDRCVPFAAPKIGSSRSTNDALNLAKLIGWKLQNECAGNAQKFGPAGCIDPWLSTKDGGYFKFIYSPWFGCATASMRLTMTTITWIASWSWISHKEVYFVALTLKRANTTKYARINRIIFQLIMSAIVCDSRFYWVILLIMQSNVYLTLLRTGFLIFAERDGFPRPHRNFHFFSKCKKITKN